MTTTKHYNLHQLEQMCSPHGNIGMAVYPSTAVPSEDGTITLYVMAGSSHPDKEWLDRNFFPLKFKVVNTQGL